MTTVPTLAGFQTFIVNVMKVPVPPFSLADPVVAYSFGFALEWVNRGLAVVPSVPGVWTIYERAVYNLAADTLINWAQDTDGAPTVSGSKLPFWEYLRDKFGINSFVPGVIQSSSDQSTSESLLVPDAFKELTIANLSNLKTPYGRAYLGIAQSWGTTWGVS